MDGLILPHGFESFAAEALASGRYRSVGELVAAGLELLRHQEAARTALIRSLELAEAEADRDGWLSAEDVHAEMTSLIAESRHAKR